MLEHVHGQVIDIGGGENSPNSTAMVAKLKKISRSWTEDDDKQLLAMTAQKRTSQSIALSLRRTKAAITSRLSILRTAKVAHGQKDTA